MADSRIINTSGHFKRLAEDSVSLKPFPQVHVIKHVSFTLKHHIFSIKKKSKKKSIDYKTKFGQGNVKTATTPTT